MSGRGRIRIESEFRSGGATHSIARIVDLDEYSDEVLAKGDAVVAELIAAMEAEGVADPIGQLLTNGDARRRRQRAYERVAAQRGVLAL